MIEKFKTFLTRFNPHSKVFIIGVFCAIFLTLIFITIRARISQQDQTKTIQPTPTPRALIPGRDFVQGQISVKFQEGLSDSEINNSLVKYNARIKSTITGINVKVVEVPIGQEETVRKQLIGEGIVKYADLDYVAHTLTNDTNFANQYWLKNTGQSIKGQAGNPNADIKAEQAWNVTKGAGVKVAILDTGLDMNHPELASKVVLQKVFNTNSIDDQFGHGTHVAGIVSAITGNTQGIAGTCPDCQLIIGKVMDDSGYGAYSVISQGMTWAADNGAKVINMSLGGYQSDNVLADATKYAWDKGSIVVAAAGNDNTTNMFYPAPYPNVVSVAATDNKDQKASFSNYGSWVQIAAPGKDIFSTLPTHSYGLQSKGIALNYDYLSGTSMATPMVSGIAALLWSTPPYNSSNQTVVDRLYATVDKIPGSGSSWQKGRVNAAAAVASGSANLTPTITQGPSITASPTAGISPTNPAPTFVCGGSKDSVCNSPTPTVSTTPTPTLGPTISQQPSPTITEPTLTPTPTPVPDEDCLDINQSAPERIMNWVKGFLKKINDYIQGVLGNPQAPRSAPPQPCIIR